MSEVSPDAPPSSLRATIKKDLKKGAAEAKAIVGVEAMAVEDEGVEYLAKEADYALSKVNAFLPENMQLDDKGLEMIGAVREYERVHHVAVNEIDSYAALSATKKKVKMTGLPDTDMIESREFEPYDDPMSNLDYGLDP